MNGFHDWMEDEESYVQLKKESGCFIWFLRLSFVIGILALVGSVYYYFIK